MIKTIANFELAQALSRLRDFENKKLPQKVSYAILKNKMTLDKEFKIYQAALKGLYGKYNEYFSKDEETGELVLVDNGFPQIEDEKISEDFYSDLSDLLNISLEIDLYTIDESCFEWDDAGNRYDALTLQELMFLVSLCTDAEI